MAVQKNAFSPDRQHLKVKRGRTTLVERATAGSDASWNVTIKPRGSGRRMIEVRLPKTTNCSASGAICTSVDLKLTNSLRAVVRGALSVVVDHARVEVAQGAKLRFKVRLNRETFRPVEVDYASAGTRASNSGWTRSAARAVCSSRSTRPCSAARPSPVRPGSSWPAKRQRSR